MSSWVAVPCALAAAVAYGAATAVQHHEAHAEAHVEAHVEGHDEAHDEGHDEGHVEAGREAHDEAGREADPVRPGPASTARTSSPADLPRASARRLATLLVNPRWLLAVAGDAVGLVLQIVALASGPVVLIQPLLVLALPVALPVGWALGGPRPGRGDLASCGLIIGALAAFFVVVADPGPGRPLGGAAAAALLASAAVVAAAVLVAVHRRSARVRAVGYGALAGSAFGVVGVLIDASAMRVDTRGIGGLAGPAGALPLLGVIALGAAGIVLTQISFQLGELAASFPANESAAPVVAVVLGAAVLGERVPASAPFVLAYLGVVGAIVLGTVRLAQPRPAPSAPPR